MTNQEFIDQIAVYIKKYAAILVYAYTVQSLHRQS